MTGPEASVAVASRGRPLRLRWLLNALAEQTVSPERFEVLVAHPIDDFETALVLNGHPLSELGHLRGIGVTSPQMTPGAGRNAAWRAARGSLVLFTDDDCRPAPDWIERALDAARGCPGATLQGRTLPDPDEIATRYGAPWAHSQDIDPVSPWAQTCNIVYPRETLERVGGFDERMRAGEDADLAARALRIGARIVAAPQLLVFHAVEERPLVDAIRGLTRWSDLAMLVRRNPELRRHLLWGVWWKPEHAALAAALCGVALSPRRRWALGMALPWAGRWMRIRGWSARGVARSITELPGHALIDAAEIAVLLSGSVREHTLIV